MKLNILGSNSEGNAYILEASNGEALLLECGVNFNKVKQALGFSISRVAGCLVTHEHKDHCKYVNEVLRAGIEVWSGYDTHIAMGTKDHHRAKVTFDKDKIMVGSFHVRPFEVKHDAAEPLGYMIRHAECGTVLFLTDSYYCEYKFTGLNNIIIEANYCQQIIDDRVAAGANPKFLRDRVITSHMSLQTCKQTLKEYDLSAVNNIVLIHLSNGNSDEKRFQREVQEITGKTVHVANAGMVIPFDKTPF